MEKCNKCQYWDYTDNKCTLSSKNNNCIYYQEKIIEQKRLKD